MAEVHEYQSSYQMMSDVAGHTESSSLVYRGVHMLKAPLMKLLPCIHAHTLEFLCHGMGSVIIMTAVEFSLISRKELGAFRTTTLHGEIASQL